MYIPMNIYY